MQRSFQYRLKLACLGAVMAGSAGLLTGCGDSAKPISEDSKQKMMDQYKSRGTQYTRPSGSGGGSGGSGGGNSPSGSGGGNAPK